MKAKIFVAMLAVSVVMVGCKKREMPPGPQVPLAQSKAQPAQEIAWFRGGLEAAFVSARAANKPVFLYWGAEWCPYCKDLKANVFSRRDFIEKLRLFVPVYLDGDDPGAQKAGQEFSITGYPTVIVLRDDRTELARIGGGMDRSQYAEVLDLVLADTKPVSELLTSMAAGSGTLAADDCRRLALNAWVLDDETMKDSQRLADGLQRAAELCPVDARVERARLSVVAASAAAARPQSAQFKKLLTGLQEILADRALATSVADTLRYLDDKFFAAAQKADAAGTMQLVQSWNGVMDAIAADERYTPGDRLAAVNGKLLAAKALDSRGQIPAALAVDAKQRVEVALAGKYDDYTRAGLINAALNTLGTLGDSQRAYEVAEGEMKVSQTPYYYMSDLGSIEEERGHNETALDWFERAYRESKGAATRFQWGANYVNALLRMTPYNESRIQKATGEVLGELDGPNRLYKRTRMRLDELNANLRKWNADGAHATTLASIRKRMEGICAKIPQSDSAREACSQFLAKTA